MIATQGHLWAVFELMRLDELPRDLIARILLSLNGESLARLQGVDRRWYDNAGDNGLWLKMLQQRFHVKMVKNRHLRNAGDVVWKSVYVNWRSIRRMPSSQYCGQRFPVLAGNTDRDVHAWVTIRPSENCLVLRNQILLRVVVQNVTDRPIYICARNLHIDLKGADVKPSVATKVVGVFRAKHIGHNYADERAAAVRLGLYDFVVIQAKVSVPANCAFEPEALERLAGLTTFVRESLSADSSTGWAGRSIRCTFIENAIWEHYERLPGGFWVFVDRHNRC